VGVVVANSNARALRKRLTPQEVKVWVKLRELKPLGFHFRRQAPIGRYIVDFASFGDRVVVEIDGGQHDLPEGKQVDRERDEFLRSQGFNVLRYWNSDVDEKLEGVMESILSALNTPTPALRHSRCFASAFLALRTAAEGGLCPPHKGEG
jgi:very-short-patch-repair endonuclease